MITELRVGPYELLGKLGSGGMGIVYRARDTRTRAMVAVKVLHEHLTDDIDYVRRFEREAHLASQLDHPNIVRVLDAGADGGKHFLAMEMVEGETLFDRLASVRKLSAAETRGIAVAVASALDAAHAKRVIHRDIKPGNILLGRDGAIKVSDFGVARAMDTTSQTRTGTFLGSVAYAAPEVIDGHADGRSDLYSLGVVLYQALLGNVPFEAATPLAVLRMHERDAPPNLDRLQQVDKQLADVIARLLRKNPDDRLQSAAGLVRALSGEHVAANAAPSHFLRGRRYLVGGATVLLVTVMLIAAGIAFRDGDGGNGSGSESAASSRRTETAWAATTTSIAIASTTPRADATPDPTRNAAFIAVLETVTADNFPPTSTAVPPAATAALATLPPPIDARCGDGVSVTLVDPSQLGKAFRDGELVSLAYYAPGCTSMKVTYNGYHLEESVFANVMCAELDPEECRDGRPSDYILTNEVPISNATGTVTLSATDSVLLSAFFPGLLQENPSLREPSLLEGFVMCGVFVELLGNGRYDYSIGTAELLITAC